MTPDELGGWGWLTEDPPAEPETLAWSGPRRPDRLRGGPGRLFPRVAAQLGCLLVTGSWYAAPRLGRDARPVGASGPGTARTGPSGVAIPDRLLCLTGPTLLLSRPDPGPVPEAIRGLAAVDGVFLDEALADPAHWN